MKLYVKLETGRYREAEEAVVRETAADFIMRDIRRGPAMREPDAIRSYLRVKLNHLEHEMFCVIILDNRNRVIACKEMFRGTIDGCSVHPREVVKEALAHNGAAVIFAHNHPSGIAEPSQADEMITKRLKSALTLVDIRVLDHLVIAGTNITSFAERGLL